MSNSSGNGRVSRVTCPCEAILRSEPSVRIVNLFSDQRRKLISIKTAGQSYFSVRYYMDRVGQFLDRDVAQHGWCQHGCGWGVCCRLCQRVVWVHQHRARWRWVELEASILSSGGSRSSWSDGSSQTGTSTTPQHGKNRCRGCCATGMKFTFWAYQTKWHNIIWHLVVFKLFLNVMSELWVGNSV